MRACEDPRASVATVPEELARLLATPAAHRKSEDVFEIANGLLQASFIRQLDIRTRSSIARCATVYQVVPGGLINLSGKGDNALYIIICGSVKIEAAGLYFLPGDTFGFRPAGCPTFQVMVDHRVVTCVEEGIAAKVSFEDCAKIWPETFDSCRKPLPAPADEASPASDLVWSPELARSILLRGDASGEERPVALEFLNFPPINGYSKELREILVSQFVMVHRRRGALLREWVNLVPIDPNDIRLSRIQLDSVVIVVSGSLRATCRRRGASEGQEDEFVLMRLNEGNVFPPQSGQMQGGRHRRDDESGYEQDVGGDWADFTHCALVAESPGVEALLVNAHIFNDVIYPGVDLRYSMERVREILSKCPRARTWRDIGYMARNVLSHHVNFQQMTTLSLERIASRLTDIVVAPGGQVLVCSGEKVTSFMLLLTGSASIIAVSKVAKSRSQTRRMKVGRLEPGDLWGVQHMQAGMEAEFEIVAVESCEIIRGHVDDVRAAEKRGRANRPLQAKARKCLEVPPEKRTRQDVRNIVAEMGTSKSGLDVARFRHVPACLKKRIAASLRVEEWPPFRELIRGADGDGSHVIILEGSVSLQVVSKSQRFNIDTLELPEGGPLKILDVDNALALDDWRVSGFGPCTAMLFERQVIGEHPNSDEVVPSVRAVTRQRTTGVLVDARLYNAQLSKLDPTNAHALVCREVLGQLKICTEGQPSAGSLDFEMLFRLIGSNAVLRRLNTTCRLRLSGALSLAHFSPGEVVTEADDYGDNLVIILEGHVEYFVQDLRMGAVDRALAKEAGMVPSLRCVGVMTSGDFVAPSSMMGTGRRRRRAIRAGSYRMRCSPDSCLGGATCLLLSRQRLEDAIQRDRSIRSAIAREKLLHTASLTADEREHAQGQRVLATVKFGEPEPASDGESLPKAVTAHAYEKGTGWPVTECTRVMLAAESFVNGRAHALPNRSVEATAASPPQFDRGIEAETPANAPIADHQPRSSRQQAEGDGMKKPRVPVSHIGTCADDPTVAATVASAPDPCHASVGTTREQAFMTGVPFHGVPGQEQRVVRSPPAYFAPWAEAPSAFDCGRDHQSASERDRGVTFSTSPGRSMCDDTHSFFTRQVVDSRDTPMYSRAEEGTSLCFADVPRAPSNRNTQTRGTASLLQPTPLCCGQVLPPTTFGGDLGLGSSQAASIRHAIARDAREARAAMIYAASVSGTYPGGDHNGAASVRRRARRRRQDREQLRVPCTASARASSASVQGSVTEKAFCSSGTRCARARAPWRRRRRRRRPRSLSAESEGRASALHLESEQISRRSDVHSPRKRAPERRDIDSTLRGAVPRRAASNPPPSSLARGDTSEGIERKYCNMQDAKGPVEPLALRVQHVQNRRTQVAAFSTPVRILRRSPPVESTRFRNHVSSRNAAAPRSHLQRCGPLFRKGFSKGGMGKQAELMEQMAKAKRDRLKREFEEKLRESGDLPPAQSSSPEKPATASVRARMKPERSWREAAAGKAGMPRADASRAAPEGVATNAGAKKVTRAGPVVGKEVWPSTKEEGRAGGAYDAYEDLLEGTADHKGSRKSPGLANPKASFAAYDALREKKQWDAVVAGKSSVANRSPLASESEYQDFEAMLTEGVRVTPDNLGPQVAEKRLMQRAERQLPQAFTSGDFAPLDPWRALSDTEGAKVNFGLFQGTKPLLVVADPIPESSEMRQTMYELNTRMPRKMADVVAITVDPANSNRKAVKKSRLSFPVLSDESGEWMQAYRVTSGGQREKMAFLIEPALGNIVNVWSGFDALSLVDLVKDYMSPDR